MDQCGTSNVVVFTAKDFNVSTKRFIFHLHYQYSNSLLRVSLNWCMLGERHYN